MIIKRENKRNFTTLNNEVVEDSRLSYEALGLLTYLLSRPEDWEVHVDQLRSRTKIGRDKLYRIVGELQEAGYMEHERVRERGSITSGRWIVREQPILEQDSTEAAEMEPHPENTDEAISPHPEKPPLAEPHPANQDAYKDSTDTNSEQGQSERDAGARAREDEETEGHVPHHKLLARLIELHPQSAHDSVADTHAAWKKLSPAERHDAVDRLPEWLASKGARKAIAGLPIYLSERRWTMLGAKPGSAESQPANVPAFSRAWWWCLHRTVAGSIGDWAAKGSAVRTMINIRADAARTFAGGWPVNAAKRDAIIADSEALTQVPKDGSEAKAWAWYYQQIGITMPIPDQAQWIFVPTDMPVAPEDFASVAEQTLSR